jgi:hypothetical protein
MSILESTRKMTTNEKMCYDMGYAQGKQDAVPVVRGRWRTWEEQFPDRTTRKKNNLGVFCSACQLHADNMTSYCPNCGAKMEDKL